MNYYIKKFLSHLFYIALVSLVCFGCKKNSADEKKFSSWRELNRPEIKVGARTGGVSILAAIRELPRAEIIDHTDISDCYIALLSGKIDAIVFDKTMLEYACSEKPNFLILPDYLEKTHVSIATNLRNHELIKRVDEFIAQYRKDGTYEKMYNRWVKNKDPQMPHIPEPQKPAGTLKIGTCGLFIPMNYFGKNNQLAGFEVELCKRLALFLNRKCEFVTMPFSGLLPACQTGKVDLAICQINATPERRESLLFSTPYIDSPTVAMILKKNYANKFSIIDALNQQNIEIGIPQAATSTILAPKVFPNAKLMYITTIPDGYAAVHYKKVDAYLFDKHCLLHAAKANLELTVIPQAVGIEQISVGFPKSHVELQKKVNNFIKEYRANGTYKEMYQRWIVEEPPRQMPVIPKVEKPKYKYKVGTQALNAPMNFYGKNGELIGFDIEFIKRLALYLDAELEIITMSFDGLLPAISSGKIDMLISNMNVTSERKEKMLVSDTYIDSTINILMRKDHPLLITHNNDLNNSETNFSLIQFFKNIKISFERSFLQDNRWKLVLNGLYATVIITIFSGIFGTILAFPICYLRQRKCEICNFLAKTYVSVIQGTPMLVFLMIIFYVIFAKSNVNGTYVAIFAFSLNFAAYVSEMLNSGINAIPKGQREAALALGFSRVETFIYVILPQTVRQIMPVYRGEFIHMLKGTSIVGYVAIQDLTRVSDIIRSRTYEAFFPLLTTTAIYFFIAWLLTHGLIFAEHKLDPSIRAKRGK